MKEKDLLKSIKKIIVNTTPNHMPLFEKQTMKKGKAPLWATIPLTAALATALVIGLVSSNPTIPSLNSSGINVRRPVSQMMASLDDTYTLNFLVDGLTIYEYEVAQPIIRIAYNLSFSEVNEYYVDLTKTESPRLYQRYEDNTWYASTGNAYEIMSLLSPLNFIDPNIVEDEWFTWNETMSGYQLDETFIPNLFENSPLAGVENLSIWMTLSGDLVIELGGRMVDENPNDFVSMQLIYSRIGGTSVTLPTNVINVQTSVIDDLLQDSTNHRYEFSFSPLSEDLSSLPFIYQYGERDGGTFRTTVYTYDLNGGAYVETYTQPTIDAYIQIVSTDQGYLQNTLDESEYQSALTSFYPINVLPLREAWLDLGNPQFIEAYGMEAYPILPAYLDNLINLPIEGTLSNMEAFAFIGQTINIWLGVTIRVILNFEINNLPYQIYFQIASFDRIDSIYIPSTPYVQTTLEESLATAVGTASYFLEQTHIKADGTRQNNLQLVRAGNDYQRFDFTKEGYLDIVYAGKENNSYFQYKYQYNQGKYVKSSIDQATYQSLMIEPQWLQLDYISGSTISPIAEQPGRYEVDFETNPNLFATSLTNQFEIEDVTIVYTDLYVGLPMIIFEIEANHNLTNEDVLLEAKYSYLGVTDVIFPTPQDSTNPDTHNASLTIETFNELYANNVYSFIGTYFTYDELGEFSEYEVFSLQEDEALRINRFSGDFVQYLNTEGGYQSITGNLKNNETTIDTTDQATFEIAQEALSYINFDVFTTENLTQLNENETFYQINTDVLDDLFNFSLPEEFDIQEAYVEINQDYVYFQIIALEENNHNTMYIYLMIEAINQDVNLLDFFNPGFTQ
jgi:hypothetical protein